MFVRTGSPLSLPGITWNRRVTSPGSRSGSRGANALVYRAWRCLADLEAKMGREAKQEAYTKLASRLKAAHAKTLFNPRTGWLAWWKSRDGELHDYASPTLNGLAIEYGLVEPGLGRQILDRLWKKIEEVGFTRFERQTLSPALGQEVKHEFSHRYRRFRQPRLGRGRLGASGADISLFAHPSVEAASAVCLS
jgi:hypothetical protein